MPRPRLHHSGLLVLFARGPPAVCPICVVALSPRPQTQKSECMYIPELLVSATCNPLPCWCHVCRTTAPPVGLSGPPTDFCLPSSSPPSVWLLSVESSDKSRSPSCSVRTGGGPRRNAGKMTSVRTALTSLWSNLHQLRNVDGFLSVSTENSWRCV